MLEFLLRRPLALALLAVVVAIADPVIPAHESLLPLVPQARAGADGTTPSEPSGSSALATPAAAGEPLPAAVCASVEAEFARYPDNLWGTVCRIEGDERCPLGAILNRVAWQHRADGWGLSRKDFGYFVASPAGPVASDILQRGSVIWDVLSSHWQPVCGGGEDTRHVWDAAYRASRPFVAPVDPGGSAGPGPCPICPPDLSARVTELEALVHAIEADRDAWIDAAGEARGEAQQAIAEADQLRAQVAELEARPIPVGCQGQRIFGLIKTSCRLVY